MQFGTFTGDHDLRVIDIIYLKSIKIQKLQIPDF